jgi:hypothetical protein
MTGRQEATEKGLLMLKRVLAICSLSLPLLLVAMAADSKKMLPMRVQCTGVLTQEGDKYSLSGNYKGYGSINNVWCDAAFSRDIEPKAYQALMKSACRVGDKCQIAGVVNGHGVFYWVQVNSVRRL